MLPENPTPAQPSVTWDSSVGRFRDNVRGGFVSNLTGILTLTQGVENGEVVYRDLAGHLAPDPVDLNYPGYNLNFVNVNRIANPTEQDVYSQPAAPNSYYTTTAIYTDNEGNLRTVTINSAVGKTVNFDLEQRVIAKQIADDLGIPLGQEGSAGILQRSLKLLHYQAE